MRAATLALAALCSVALVAGCGGDDEDEAASAADLKTQLTSESQIPGFDVEESFEWDNASDAAHEGINIPEATPPEEPIEVLEEAGFEAGVGQRLIASSGETSSRGPFASVVVIESGSEEDAATVRDYLHEQDLEQPCIEACSVDTSELAVEGIPTAKGAAHQPPKNPPPNAPPAFEAYTVEFTIGPRLYIVSAGGEPSQVVKAASILDAARRLYARNENAG